MKYVLTILLVVEINMLFAGLYRLCMSLTPGLSVGKLAMILFNSYSLTKLTKLNASDSLVFLHAISSKHYTYLVFTILLAWGLVYKHQPTLAYTLVFLWIFYYYVNNPPLFLYQRMYTNVDRISGTLQNGLVSIHPLLIYYIYTRILYMAVHQHLGTHKFRYFLNSFIELYRYLWMILFGIFLGAVWANQELNWGGFWSWDPIELVSLWLFLYLIMASHIVTFRGVARPPVYLIVATTVGVYILVRIGILNTVHAFVQTSGTPTYIIVLVICVLLYHTWYKYRLVIAQNLKQQVLVQWRVVSKNVRSAQKLFVYRNLVFGSVLTGVSLELTAPVQNIVFLTTVENVVVTGEPQITLIILVSICVLVYGQRMEKTYITWQKSYDITFVKHVKSYVAKVIFFWEFTVSQLINTRNNMTPHTQVHATLLFIYSVFVIFFSQIIFFDSKYTPVTYHNVAVTLYTTNTGFAGFYETRNHLNRFFTYKYKPMIEHTPGFCIPTNGYFATYSYVKTTHIHNIFCEEVLFIALCVTTIGFLCLSWCFNVLQKKISNY